jgi:hypothetical protein
MAQRRDRVWLGPLLIATIAALVLVRSERVHAKTLVAVSTCGQEYAGDGYLTGDLDCTGSGGPAVSINGKGRLALQGFTITGGDVGIVCLQSCRITGPGALIAPASTGIASAGALTVSNLTIADSGGDGIVGYRQVRVVDSTLVGNGGSGVRSQRVVIRGSLITANASFGALSGPRRRVVLRDSQVTGNGIGDACALGAPCADVASGRKPRLRHSVCDTSWDSSSPDGGDWKVCLED